VKINNLIFFINKIRLKMNNKIRLKMNNKLLYHHFKKIIIIFNKINLTKFESLLLKIFLVRMKKNLKIQKDK
jgi:hypothetical protein